MENKSLNPYRNSDYHCKLYNCFIPHLRQEVLPSSLFFSVAFFFCLCLKTQAIVEGEHFHKNDHFCGTLLLQNFPHPTHGSCCMAETQNSALQTKGNSKPNKNPQLPKLVSISLCFWFIFPWLIADFDIKLETNLLKNTTCSKILVISEVQSQSRETVSLQPFLSDAAVTGWGILTYA